MTGNGTKIGDHDTVSGQLLDIYYQECNSFSLMHTCGRYICTYIHIYSTRGKHNSQLSFRIQCTNTSEVILVHFNPLNLCHWQPVAASPVKFHGKATEILGKDFEIFPGWRVGVGWFGKIFLILSKSTARHSLQQS